MEPTQNPADTTATPASSTADVETKQQSVPDATPEATPTPEAKPADDNASNPAGQPAIRFTPIDLNNLDTILETHAFDYQQATDILPDLKFDHAQAKLRVDQTRSTLYLKIRADLEQANEKPTETKLASLVDTQPSYMEAQRAVLIARRALDKGEQVREVFMQREQSIRHLVALHGQQYWSLHSVDKGARGGGAGLPARPPVSTDKQAEPAFATRALEKA